jgi:hypothetical protein
MSRLTFAASAPRGTVMAKVRPLKRGDLKVTCGRDHPCPTALGIAVKARGKGMTVADSVVWSVRDLAGEQPKSRWTLYAPEAFLGYYSDRDDPERAYRLIKPKTKPDEYGRPVAHRLGRTAKPKGLQSMGALAKGGKSRGIVGEFPSVPAVVICPNCGSRNVVEVPPGVVD